MAVARFQRCSRAARKKHVCCFGWVMLFRSHVLGKGRRYLCKASFFLFTFLLKL